MSDLRNVTTPHRPIPGPACKHTDTPHWDQIITLGVVCMNAKSLQSYPTLSDAMDCSPLGSSVRGILQVRILEWAVVSSSRGSS